MYRQCDMIDNVSALALVFLSKLFPIRISLENRMNSTPLRTAVVCLATMPLPMAVVAQNAPPPTPRPAPTVVAGIPVNYDEAKVGTYNLPDALALENGKPVRDEKSW